MLTEEETKIELEAAKNWLDTSEIRGDHRFFYGGYIAALKTVLEVSE